MNEADYEVAFQIIAFAGNAKSSAMMAIREARNGNFEEAQQLLEAADADVNKAHGSQTKLLTQEARGNGVPINIILIHAQDHLTAAMLTRDLAAEIIELHKLIKPAANAL
ncbi:MAG: PTS lactose/cellobiose transporter subunit IIA [Ancrocorticia sp.]